MKRFIAFVSTALVCSGLFSASLPSVSELQSVPPSVEKDYYIWRYLQHPGTDRALAYRLIRQASRLNDKLKQAYIAKTNTPPPVVTPKYPPTPEHIWKPRLRAKKAFDKAMTAIRKGDLQAGKKHLLVAEKNYLRQENIDKTRFWLYLVTKQKRYLQQLKRSHDPNLYTLLTADAFGSKYPKTQTFTFRKKYTAGFDATDPLDWAKLKNRLISHPNLKRLAKQYASKECIGVCTYILSKSHPKRHNIYFPMPYRNHMKRLPVRRQALIYAIARQESRFIPSAVSPSFALGMMQIMPFLVKHIAKERGEDIDLDDIFHPHKAIEYADHHLNYLEKYLKHPLFIAYAYNGGIGFTKRLLKSGKYFTPGPFEPYLSIETIPNKEAKEYGKKVLTNYVIYLNKLGRPTRITPLIKELTIPNKTDRFRN